MSSGWIELSNLGLEIVTTESLVCFSKCFVGLGLEIITTETLLFLQVFCYLGVRDDYNRRMGVSPRFLLGWAQRTLQQKIWCICKCFVSLGLEIIRSERLVFLQVLPIASISAKILFYRCLCRAVFLILKKTPIWLVAFSMRTLFLLIVNTLLHE